MQWLVGAFAPGNRDRDHSITPVRVEATDQAEALARAYEQGLPRDIMVGHWIDPVD